MNNRFRFGIVSLALLAGMLYAHRGSRTGQSSEIGLVADTRNSLMQLLIDQPDFMAEETERRSEDNVVTELRGLSASYSVAKRGLSYRRERAVVISYARPGEQTLLLYPRSREYVESPRLGVWFENVASPSLLVIEHGANLAFESFGDELVEGHRCARTQVSVPKEAVKSALPTKVIYYVARDLRNLVIRTDLIDPLGTTIYMLKNVSFDVPSELFRVPTGYQRSEADPTAEYRLLDYFQLADLRHADPKSFRNALLEKLPPGTTEEEIYRYLEGRLIGKDRFSSYHRAQGHERIVCRVEYDATLPGPTKKHFAVFFLLDRENKLRDVHLNSWISAP